VQHDADFTLKAARDWKMRDKTLTDDIRWEVTDEHRSEYNSSQILHMIVRAAECQKTTGRERLPRTTTSPLSHSDFPRATDSAPHINTVESRLYIRVRIQKFGRRTETDVQVKIIFRTTTCKVLRLYQLDVQTSGTYNWETCNWHYCRSFLQGPIWKQHGPHLIPKKKLR